MTINEYIKNEHSLLPGASCVVVNDRGRKTVFSSSEYGQKLLGEEFGDRVLHEVIPWFNQQITLDLQ